VVAAVDNFVRMRRRTTIDGFLAYMPTPLTESMSERSDDTLAGFWRQFLVGLPVDWYQKLVNVSST